MALESDQESKAVAVTVAIVYAASPPNVMAGPGPSYPVLEKDRTGGILRRLICFEWGEHKAWPLRQR